MTDTPIDIEGLRALLERATPGPWWPSRHNEPGSVDRGKVWAFRDDAPGGQFVVGLINEYVGRLEDQRLMAAAPDLARALIRVEAERDEARDGAAFLSEEFEAVKMMIRSRTGHPVDLTSPTDMVWGVLDLLDTARSEERDALRERVAMLERVLAVERGDESQAPEGWRIWRKWGVWWRKTPRHVTRRRTTSIRPLPDMFDEWGERRHRKCWAWPDQSWLASTLGVGWRFYRVGTDMVMRWRGDAYPSALIAMKSSTAPPDTGEGGGDG